MSYTVRPIDSWPGPQSSGRRNSPFRAPWSQTAELLDRELRMLGASRTVLMIAVDEQDIRLDGLLRANARPTHPGVIIAFESRYGALKYASDVFTDWRDNVRAIALGLEALRKVDRYGITKRGEQYTGWRALPPAGDGVMTHDDAVRVIDRHGGGSIPRALRATHPDTGGNASDFAEVQAARKIIEASR
jgi:hypothetical protein